MNIVKRQKFIEPPATLPHKTMNTKSQAAVTGTTVSESFLHLTTQHLYKWLPLWLLYYLNILKVFINSSHHQKYTTQLVTITVNNQAHSSCYYIFRILSCWTSTEHCSGSV